MNPAKRLHTLLIAGKKMPRNQSMIAAWANVLGLPSTEITVVFVGLAEMQNLVSEVESCIRRIPGENHALYLRSMPQIRSVLAVPNLEQSWSVFLERLPDTALADLDFCADLISKHVQEHEVADDELRWISDQVSELSEKVLQSSMPKALRIALLDLLESMRSAVATYRVRGAKGLRKALAVSIGELLLRYPEVRSSNEEPELKEFWAFATTLDKIICKALEYMPLLEKALPLLQG